MLWQGMAYMDGSVYLEIEFLALVLFSVLIPAYVFIWLVRRRRIARATVCAVGAALVLIAATDAILLQRLGVKAKATPDLADDYVFASEFSIALFILPLFIAGLGVNMVSHVLNQHLIIAELEYDRDKDDQTRQGTGIGRPADGSPNPLA